MWGHHPTSCGGDSDTHLELEPPSQLPWLYLINGMDNGLEDGMVYGMEHWEEKFTVFDALLLLAL